MKNLRKIFFLFILSILCTSCIKDNSQIQIVFIKPYKNNFYYETVNRKIENKENKLKQAIIYLLEGVNQEEKQKNLTSEIPMNTHLLNFEEKKNKIFIDLSSDFTKGGGSISMLVRLQQLIKTIKISKPEGKEVFLLIEGKKIVYIGGEGITIDNPIIE